MFIAFFVILELARTPKLMFDSSLVANSGANRRNQLSCIAQKGNVEGRDEEMVREGRKREYVGKTKTERRIKRKKERKKERKSKWKKKEKQKNKKRKEKKRKGNERKGKERKEKKIMKERKKGRKKEREKTRKLTKKEKKRKACCTGS